jgi:hypothetical protein
MYEQQTTSAYRTHAPAKFQDYEPATHHDQFVPMMGEHSHPGPFESVNHSEIAGQVAADAAWAPLDYPANIKRGWMYSPGDDNAPEASQYSGLTAPFGYSSSEDDVRTYFCNADGVIQIGVGVLILATRSITGGEI